MRCFQCGRGTMAARDAEVRGEVRGEAVVVRTEAMVCSRCGFQSLTDQQSEEYVARSADAYRESKGLLTGRELRALRDRLGMNQVAFAHYLKVGVASIKRWELGLIQDHAMDELIRLRTDERCARRNVEELQARLAKAHAGTVASSEVVVPARPRVKMEWDEWGGSAMVFDGDTCYGG